MLYVLTFIGMLDGQPRESIFLDVAPTKAECERLGHLLDGQLDQLAAERFGPRAHGVMTCKPYSREHAADIARRLTRR